MIVVLSTRNVMQLQHRRVRLAADGAGRVFRAEPAQPLLSAVFLIKLLTHGRVTCLT